jgi:hypothetical protein
MKPASMRHRNRIQVFIIHLLALCLGWPQASEAYSVLTHETIIDAAWETDIQPLLLKRFPHSTPEDLRKAHAYAYGGAIIQDMGYYPHGNEFFSDLAHYVRSGDFIEALLRDSQDLNEFAFAIGALAHYASDNNGHRLATNLAVPVLYPKLKTRFGNTVTYEDDPTAHIKTEFGFDVLEVAKERYAPDSYHSFIGFEVSLPLLERAFCETYGLELNSILPNENQVINSYRHSVSSLIPQATRIAWKLKEDDIRKDIPGVTRKKFLYNLSRASYEQEWGRDYRRPSAWDTFLAFIYRILPKIGPLRVLTFRTPTPQTEKMFEDSFNVTMDRYRNLLGELRHGEVKLANDNFDVGEPTVRGKYWLMDAAYEELVDKLAANNFAETPPELRADILRFFSAPEAASAVKAREKSKQKSTEQSRARLKEELERLESAVPDAFAKKDQRSE